MFDSLIFDIDGTLWDSTGICADAWNSAINENSDLKAEITAEQLKGLFGKPMDVIFNAIFGEVEKSLADMLIEKCCEYEDRLLKEHSSEELIAISFEGVVDTIKKLSEKYKLFIVSNCQKGYIEILIDKLGLEDYIIDHLCFGDTLTSKGQTMIRVIERNELKNPAYVGDTLGDKEACEEAGVPFIWASYGFGKVEEYYAAIDKFEDLLTLE